MGESEGVINGMKSPGQWGGWDPEQGRAGAKQKGPCQLGTGSQGEGLGGTGSWGTGRPERSLGAATSSGMEESRLLLRGGREQR